MGIDLDLGTLSLTRHGVGNDHLAAFLERAIGSSCEPYSNETGSRTSWTWPTIMDVGQWRSNPHRPFRAHSFRFRCPCHHWIFNTSAAMKISTIIQSHSSMSATGMACAVDISACLESCQLSKKELQIALDRLGLQTKCVPDSEHEPQTM